MQVKLSWFGGAEALFGGTRETVVEVPQEEGQKPWDIRRLLQWLKDDSDLCTGNKELFFSGDSVKNGILVLVNDTDWELMDELDCTLEKDDHITFISTLHGG